MLFTRVLPRQSSVFRGPTIRTMASVSEFLAAAVRSDPALLGSNDDEKDTIKQLESETEGMAKDISVGLANGTACSPILMTYVQILDERLTPLTYLHSNTHTTADVSLYCHVHPSMVSLPVLTRQAGLTNSDQRSCFSASEIPLTPPLLPTYPITSTSPIRSFIPAKSVSSTLHRYIGFTSSSSANDSNQSEEREEAGRRVCG